MTATSQEGANRPSAPGQERFSATRIRLERGVAQLPLADRDRDQQVTFGLASAPVRVRSLDHGQRIPAHTAWAISRSRTWQISAPEPADLRLVHISGVASTGFDSRPARFDGAHGSVVRALIRAATPTWVDEALRSIENLGATDPSRVRPLDAPRETRAMADLAAMLATLMPQALRASTPEFDAELMPLVQLIDAHLADRSLAPDQLASWAHLSRRALQTSFAPFGGVAAFIRRRRVDAAISLLTAAVDDVPDLDQVAERTGLGSRRTLERAVRGTYGLTPVQARRRVLSGQSLTAIPPQRDGLAS